MAVLVQHGIFISILMKQHILQALGALVAAAAAIGNTDQTTTSTLNTYFFDLLKGFLHPDTEAQA